VDKVEQWEFMFWGFLTFDNIGVSILSIFRVITLEDWSYVMYNYMDSSGIIAAIYFPLLVVLGGFFLLNLFLAVIMESFADMSSRPV
jgi:voltage-gated sodium channel